jgi:hypothetical protein
MLLSTLETCHAYRHSSSLPSKTSNCTMLPGISRYIELNPYQYRTLFFDITWYRFIDINWLYNCLSVANPTASLNTQPRQELAFLNQYQWNTRSKLNGKIRQFPPPAMISTANPSNHPPLHITALMVKVKLSLCSTNQALRVVGVEV